MLYLVDPIIQFLKLIRLIDTNQRIEYEHHFLKNYTYLEYIWQLVKKSQKHKPHFIHLMNYRIRA